MSLDSHFKSGAQSRSSKVFKKIQDMKIPPIAAFSKLTGLDDARILKQVDGLDMEHEHILNKCDFTDWNEARRMLNLRPACLPSSRSTGVLFRWRFG